jgi:FMN phosphatase YigB (HAD superfamily)
MHVLLARGELGRSKEVALQFVNKRGEVLPNMCLFVGDIEANDIIRCTLMLQ